jgi:translation initiation factor 4E
MHLKNPADIPQGANYHLFKEGIKPMWEDPANQRGGKWTSTYPKQARSAILNKAWFDTISAVLGEQFENGDDITGIVISMRKMGDRIAIWTKTCDNKEKTMKTGY